MPIRARRAALLAGAVLLLAAAPAALAAVLGKPPAPATSRCAGLRGSPRVLHVGSLLRLSAGPRSAACGGPSSTVHWAWPDEATDEEIGFTIVSGCKRDGAKCVLRAFLPSMSLRDRWTQYALNGSSKDGGWDSTVPYAILSDGRVQLGGTVSISDSHPLARAAVHLKGKHVSTTVRTRADGTFVFPVKEGTYTVSVKRGHTTLHGRYKITRDFFTQFDFSTRTVRPPSTA